MANKYPDTTHLKVGNTYKDVVHTAKIQGAHWTDAYKQTEIYETKPSNPSANDIDNPRGWAPINKAAVPNTYTSAKGGSKRLKHSPD